jgi:hypothetical protein
MTPCTLASSSSQIWWAQEDLNLRPSDSGLCNFRYSLDYTFIIAFALDGRRLVSTPSTMFPLKLGSVLPYDFSLRVHRI